ncbi:MAG: PAS domain-containing protein [Leadbetterella sp.]
MFNITPSMFCDTYKNAKYPTPLQSAYEFMERPSSYEEDLRICNDFSVQNEWEFDKKEYENYLRNRDHVLVITNKDRKIQWVSRGFLSMTGYTKSEVLSLNPKFLQGEATTSESKVKIKNDLYFKNSFKGVLQNYRKNGDVYACKISIIPIYNAQKELVNYMGFEQEVNL